MEKPRAILRVSQILIALTISVTGIAAENLYTVRSQDYGAPFDLVLTEVKRESSSSLLSVPGFHNRTAAGSRWLMCMYNDLAAKRGFRYWTVVYPDPPTETMVIAFYRSETDDVAKILGRAYIASNAFPPKPMAVERWNEKLCRSIR